MIKNIAIFLLGCLVTAALMMNLNKDIEHDHDHDHDHEHETVAIDPEKHDISIKTAAPSTIKSTFTTRGKVTLHPDRFAKIIPKVSGVVKEVKVVQGQSVKPGDTLAVIESQSIADAKSTYLASLEREKLAESQFERESRLYERKIASEEEYLNAGLAFEEAKINLRLAKQKLFALGITEDEISKQKDEELRYYEVRSPIRGTVVSRNITYGDYLEDTKPIFEIADLSKVLVDMGIYPKDIDKVNEGQTLEVESGELSAKGKITFVSPLIDEDTITARALAEIDNREKKWKPGTFVKVTINTENTQVPLAVAKEAVQYIEGNPVVFVQTGAGFIMKLVELGKSDRHSIEITDGLEPGQNYAASNAFLLKADLGKDTLEHEH